MSEDEGLRQQSALQVSSIVISDQALEPQYATAARLALFHAMTSTAPAPSAPTGPPSCLDVRPGTPPAVVQEYARQVLERLPAWEVDGFPVDEAGRLRDLVSPIAAGRSTLGLGPCPVG